MSPDRPIGSFETETWSPEPGAQDRSRPPTLAPRWEILRKIGSGGQADVYLARDSEIGGLVAIKVYRSGLDDIGRERLKREVRLGRTLLHQRLVRIFEFLDGGGSPAIVMEWIPGGAVTERLRSGPLPIDEAIAIARQTLEAIAYLHAQGVVHRDIKPSNLLLDSGGAIKLGDFGLARPLPAGSEVSQTVTEAGTPAYLPPEVFEGRHPDERSDIYSLGVTLFHLLTGRLPFEGGSVFEIARKHRTNPPPNLRALRPDCPKWLVALVGRLLEKRPEDRFQTAAAALAALEAQRVTRSIKRALRRGRLRAAAFLIMSLLIAASWISWRDLSKAEEVVLAETMARGQRKAGRVVWERRFDLPITQALEARLPRLGGKGTVLCLSPPPLKTDEVFRPSRVLILDAWGAVIEDVKLEDLVTEWSFDFAKAFWPEALLDDIDGDGVSEVIVKARHRVFYPNALIVCWPVQRVWETVLLHSGVIRDARAARNSPQHLIVTAVNNRLGHGLSMMEMLIPTPGRNPKPPAERHVLIRPDFRILKDGEVRMLWYTILQDGPEAGSLPIASITPDRVLLGPVGSRVSLDRFGNPVAGPNAMRDLSALRLWFLDRLAELYRGDVTPGPVDVENAIARIAVEAAPLLRERPYRAALTVAAARALARTGSPLKARDLLLSDRVQGRQTQEVTFWLAHMQALAGDLETSSELLAELTRQTPSFRGQYDAYHFLLRIHTELRQNTPLAATVSSFERRTAGFISPSQQGCYHARAHLWWDQITEADTAVRSWAYFPEGDAIAVLARWRLGRTNPDDLVLLESSLRDSPDAALEIALARCAVLLGLGRSRESLGEITRTVETWEVRSRDDFMIRQTLELARALQVQALVATGQLDRAQQTGRSLRKLLRKGLLPAVLVDEALASANRPAH